MDKVELLETFRKFLVNQYTKKRRVVLIVDEAQNITTHELKMLLTRVGEGSTIVLNGDIQQSDLKGTSGLGEVIHLAKKHMMDVPVVEFGVDDIVRSGICAEWVKVFMKEGL